MNQSNKATVSLDDPRIQAALSQKGGSRQIVYREFIIIAPLVQIKEALKKMEREGAVATQQVIESVNTVLEAGYELMRTGQATQQQATDYMLDITLWFAYEVQQGRQKLEETKH